MLELLFGWRKASKCKKVMRSIQCRLKLLKNKRFSIVRQLRDDIGQLVRLGHEEIALSRAEQLYKDESLMEVYVLLDYFCEFVIVHIPYIRRHKDCPNDINEAISSLVFASARFGDLPELRSARYLFGERYGQRFVLAAMDLLPGNLVNLEIKEKLSLSSVAEHLKFRLVNEVFRDFCLHCEPLAIKYNHEWHQQLENNNHDQVSGKDLGTQYLEEMERIEVSGPLSNIKISISEVQSLESDALFCASNCPPILDPKSLVWHEAVVDNGYLKLYSPTEQKITGLASSSTSDISVRIPEENLVYLDDVEEFQSPLSKDGDSQDKRGFVFKSSILPKVETSEIIRIEECTDENASKTGSCNSRKVQKTSRKRMRKRSRSVENKSLKDVDYETYYGDSKQEYPSARGKYGRRRAKHQRKVLDNHQEPFYAKKGNSKSVNCEVTCDVLKGCGMRKPDYSRKTNVNFTAKDSSYLSESEKSVKTSSILNNEKENMDISSCYTKESARAMSMPLEQSRDIKDENILRNNSFPLQQPITLNHVHPKLPDYDELEAKFRALKKAYLRNRQH